MMNRVASICVRSLVSRKQAVKAINGLFGSKALSGRSTQLKINKSFASRTFFFSTRSKALQQQTQLIEDQSGPDPESETVIQDVTRNNQKVARIGRSKYLNIFISFNMTHLIYLLVITEHCER
jgi:hypothetical protein